MCLCTKDKQRAPHTQYSYGFCTGFKHWWQFSYGIRTGFLVGPLKTHANTITSLHQALKTHVFCITNKPQATNFEQNCLKPTCLCTKDKQRAPSTHTRTSKLTPGRPSDRNNVIHAPTQLCLARTHGTHGTHETKTKDETKPISRLRGSDKPD